VDAGRAKVNTAQAAQNAARGALAKQATIVEGIEGEIHSRQVEIFAGAIEGPRAKFLASLTETMQAAGELETAIVAGGGGDIGTIFPTSWKVEPHDEMTVFLHRKAILAVLSTLLQARSNVFATGRKLG
jgi:hypothetical protein